MPPAPTPRPFCGREAELAELELLWAEVREGGGPRVATLLAEAGLGKTRVVQEFYRRVVAAAQGAGADGSGAQPGDGYWPAELGADGDNLRVQPPEGSWRPAAPMPFLWWGLRLSDAEAENRGAAGALAAGVERDLLPHLDALHREQRRRARRAQALRVGGGLLADVATDLVPFGGLLKTLGEAGAEWRQLLADQRRDRGPQDAAALVEGRRRSLVERVLGDLDALLGGPFDARVPTVLLIDDAQFSRFDPGLVSFLEALLPAMAEGGWPLLLLVTHWEREWFAPEGAATVAGALQAWGGDDLHLLRLAPIEGLAPVVRAALPGLPDDQVALLLDRVGGHPRLLDEVLRHLTDVRRRPLFEGRDPRRALTPAGVVALRALSVDVHERVAARLAEAPDGVQRALALAAAQGSEFLPALVAATAAALAEAADDDVAASLAAGARPHAFVAPISPDGAAFTQRVVQEVARDFLSGLVDEAAAERALADALRSAMRAGIGFEQAADLERFLALVAATFEAAGEVEDRRLAAVALTEVLRRATARGDDHATAALARRLADVVEGIPDALLDADLDWLQAAIAGLGVAGGRDRQRGLLQRHVMLTGSAFEETRDDPDGDGSVDPWTGWMAASAAVAVGDWHHEDGDRERAREAYAYALAALAAIDDAGPDDAADEERLAALSTEAAVAHRLGAWASEAGDVDGAAAHYDRALALRRRLERLDPDPWRALQRGAAWRVRAELALALDPHAADPVAWRALADEQRALAAEGLGAPAGDALAATLVRLADIAWLRDDDAGMRAAGRELVELRRQWLARAAGPQRRLDLGSALRRAAAIAERAGDLGGAWAAAAEALPLLRPLVGAPGMARVREEFVAALTGAVALAARRADHDAGRALAAEALALARGELEGDDAPTLPTSARWLAVLEVAAPYAAADGPVTGHALLDEADAAFARLPEGLRWAVAARMASLEEVRARLHERAGDAAAAAAARARSVAHLALAEVRFDGADGAPARARSGSTG